MFGITADMIRSRIIEANVDFVFCAGGTPCHQFSRLAGNAPGLDGTESGTLWEFLRVLGLFAKVCAELLLPFYFLFENVVMKHTFLKEIEAALGFEAVVIDAAFFGWAHRRRVWISNFDPPPSVQQWTRRVGGRQEVQVPVAARRLPDLGRVSGAHVPRFLRGSATNNCPEGRLPCLSRPLRPGMFPRGWPEASAAARDRCTADGMRFPAYHHEQQSLCWSKGAWQRPSADQWELLFGFPDGYTVTPTSVVEPRHRETSRLSMLGNSWSVPVARIILIGLLITLGVPNVDGFEAEHLVPSVRLGIRILMRICGRWRASTS